MLGGGAVIGVGLLLASPQIWGLYQAQQLFARPPQFGSGYEFVSYSLRAQLVAHMIFQRLIAPYMDVTEMTGYLGILPWALALLAAFHWRHRARIFFLLTALVAFVLVLGNYTPVYQWLYYVPVINALRVPPRHWYEFDFALAILAGAGFDGLASQVTQTRSLSRWARALAVGLILSIGAIVAVANWPFSHPNLLVSARGL